MPPETEFVSSFARDPFPRGPLFFCRLPLRVFCEPLRPWLRSARSNAGRKRRAATTTAAAQKKMGKRQRQSAGAARQENGSKRRTARRQKERDAPLRGNHREENVFRPIDTATGHYLERTSERITRRRVPSMTNQTCDATAAANDKGGSTQKQGHRRRWAALGCSVNSIVVLRTPPMPFRRPPILTKWKKTGEQNTRSGTALAPSLPSRHDC